MVQLRVPHDAAAKIVDDAVRRFLVAFALDRRQMPPGAITASAKAIEKAAARLLDALGTDTSDLAYWHGVTGGKGSIKEAIDGVVLLQGFGRRLVERHRGKRSTRQPQPGLDIFVILLAGAYRQITGRKPGVSTECEDGRKPVGSPQRFGPTITFMKAVARHLAARLDDASEAEALRGWTYRNTLADKLLALKRDGKV
jgi:hypothetical protein